MHTQFGPQGALRAGGSGCREHCTPWGDLPGLVAETGQGKEGGSVRKNFSYSNPTHAAPCSIMHKRTSPFTYSKWSNSSPRSSRCRVGVGR